MRAVTPKPVIPLAEFVEAAGSQAAAGDKLGCTQVTIGKAVKRGDVYIAVDGGEVVEAFSKKPFPDPRMRKQKTPSAS